MLTVNQVKSRLRSGRVMYGRLLTSPHGDEWIRVGLYRIGQLNYYLGLVTVYGFIEE